MKIADAAIATKPNCSVIEQKINVNNYSLVMLAVGILWCKFYV